MVAKRDAPDPQTVIFQLSASYAFPGNPANLDPLGKRRQSQCLYAPIFSGLLARDARMNLHGGVAASRDTPDSLIYAFHLEARHQVPRRAPAQFGRIQIHFRLRPREPARGSTGRRVGYFTEDRRAAGTRG